MKMDAFLKKVKDLVLKGKETKNALWLISGRVVQMVISLFVGVLTARYLGPSNYGIVEYGAAYVAFFTCVSMLGINSVIVKNFVDYPKQVGEAIGTSLILRLMSGFLSVVVIFSVSFIVDKGEWDTILIVALCSFSLLFNAFEIFNYWFQYQYNSKRVAITTLIAYVITATYKVILLVLKKNVIWFALSTSVDYIAYALIICFFYKKDGGPKLRVSVDKAKEILRASYNFVLSGLMVSIYGYTNRIVLKQMIDETVVGYFSVATAVCSMWVFVLQAIIDSMTPTILRLYEENRPKFNKKLKQLFAVVFYLSFSVSVLFLLFGEIFIKILYGNDYLPAAGIIKILTWSTAFSYLGLSRDIWVFCNNKQRYLKYMYCVAAVINVLLNFLLIPVLGAKGAAVATLLTQICTGLLIPMCIKDIRESSKLIIDAIFLRDVFERL